MDFSPAVLKVGIDVVTADNDDIVLTSQGLSGGSYVTQGAGPLFDTNLTPVTFAAIYDPLGIDRLLIDVVNYDSSLVPMAMDNLRFEGTVESNESEPIPEPATLLLLGSGLAGLGLARRRRQKM